ncbi:Polysaccharide deacetylase [Desulfurobacterium atlanticum]|uniref:Polysaccharide deacetylase n=2 Tax=Desulfurobacterium atlanticum TaxID=240169 RepID=A0A238YV11_9BACT|nr:Polysaccharide deacetylase [Desulfurobacterium atlanticum]
MKDFKMQMEYLKNNNYNVVSLKEIIDYLKTGKPIPPKTVAITIDDGYRSTMKAFKILKKYNFPFTLFLYAEGISRHYPAYLTPKELTEIANYPKVSFGNHSYSHKRFAKLIKTMDKKKYKQLIKQDTLKAQEIIKKLTGKNTSFYAFPYGEYNKTYIEALKELNLFKGIFSQDSAAVSNLTPVYLIPRKPVVGSWSTMRKFRKMLEKEALPVIKHNPPADYIKENLINIYAEIENPENYKNCHIYISEKGWIKARKIGNRIESTKPLKITRWKNRISIECYNRKTGNFANYIWMIIH